MSLRLASRAFSGTRLATARVRFNTGAVSRRSFRTEAVLEDVVTDPDTRIPADPESGPQPGQLTPAQADRARFRCHWSVDMWRDFNPRTWLAGIDDDGAPVSDRLRAFGDTLSNALTTTGILSGDTRAAQYWAYHTARTGFFTVQAILGLAAARAAASSSSSSTEAMSRMEAIARNGWQGPLAEAFLSYYQDYENIKEGKYILPWDMTTATHRQYNPLYVLQGARRFVTEAVDALRRREAGTPEDVWLRSATMPSYYQATFHYQTDGWLSDRSAKVYPISTETLFVGRQDAMQRSALVPIAEFMAGKDPSQVRVLEVACGTGRFATFLKDNYPALDLTLSDLSPFYLAEARSNMRYWKSKRAPDLTLPGVDGNGTAFYQTAAENLSFPDETFDLVTCTYLFHELPADVRKKAAQEMARVVKPGGMVVLTDSVQLGDRPSMDAGLGGFSSFNEPYYYNYINSDLGLLFDEAGLQCDTKVMSSTTKTLSFRKPMKGESVAEIVDEIVANADAAAVAAENPKVVPLPLPSVGDNLN